VEIKRAADRNCRIWRATPKSGNQASINIEFNIILLAPYIEKERWSKLRWRQRRQLARPASPTVKLAGSDGAPCRAVLREFAN
jgi:hypothetical protein